MFKMIRLFKYNRTFKKYFDTLQMNAGMMRMCSIIVWVFFLVHLMSCFWFLQAKFNDFTPDCWVIVRGIEETSPSY